MKRRLHIDFNAGKTQFVLCGLSNNTGAIDVKIDGSVLEEKLKVLGLSFSSKLEKIRALICYLKFLSP